MTHADSTRYIRFACKQCGKVFSRVPYEHIVLHKTAQCSACNTRFTLDMEEIEAALAESQRDDSVSGPVQTLTKTPDEPDPGEQDSTENEEPLELDAEDGLDFEEPEEQDSIDSEEKAESGIEDIPQSEETLEMEADDGLDFEENEKEDSVDVEASPGPALEDIPQSEEAIELDADDGLDFDEGEEQDSTESAKEPEAHIEETPAIEETAEPAPPVHAADSESTHPFVSSLEPEKENKFDFARRLSRLSPEGWVNPLQQASEKAQDASTGDSITPALNEREGHSQFLVFTLETNEFAVPIENTIEIGMVPELTRLPHVPDWLMGITNVRGDIVSVIDIKNFLGLGAFEAGSHDRIIMLRSRSDEIHTAVIVNRIIGMSYIAEQDIETIDAEPHRSEPYLCGVFEIDGRPIAVLNVDTLLLSEDMQQLRAM